MCAIVDVNVAHEVFGLSPHPAGERFRNWINGGSGRLVAGGKLLEELENSPGFRDWSRTALNAGKMRIVNESEVNGRTERLQVEGAYRSNDPHVLALAQVSGARLLYSNDIALQRDFGNKGLIDNPRGKVYSTLNSKSFENSHKRLLGRKDLCRAE